MQDVNFKYLVYIYITAINRNYKVYVSKKRVLSVTA